MDGVAGVTIYDLVVTGIFALLIGRGIWLGFLKQITGLIALYLGYLVASQYHDRIFPFLRDVSDNPQIVFLASYALLFFATYLVAMLLGKMLAHAVQVSIVGWFDRMLGAAVGFLQGLIVTVIMHMVLGAVLPPESTLTKKCTTCPPLAEAAEVTRGLIQSEDVREALKQRKPAIALEAIKKNLEQKTGQDPKKSEKDGQKE